MAVKWYNVANKDKFESLNIPQQELNLDLEGLGLTKVVLLNGIGGLSVIFRGVMLTPYLNNRNPYAKDKTTAYLHPKTNDIWVGYETDS